MIAFIWFNTLHLAAAGPTIFVGGLATCGWMFTAYRTRRNQAEKNAYDLILLYQKEKYYVDHRAIILRKFAPYVEIDDANAKRLVDEYFDQKTYAVTGEQTTPSALAAYSLVQIINFYEYLATGIRRGILSDGLCRAYFKSTLQNFDRKKARAFIAEVMHRDSQSRTDGSKTTMFSEYLWLIDQWKCR